MLPHGIASACSVRKTAPSQGAFCLLTQSHPAPDSRAARALAALPLQPLGVSIMSIIATFDHIATRQPNAPALISDTGTLTYAELQRRSMDVALALRARGTTRESPVGIAIPRSESAVIAVLGILRAGGAYVPIDPAYPAERQQWMAEDSGALAVLVDRRLAATPSWVAASQCFDLSDLDSAGGAPFSAPEPSESDLFNILYTSGSTGRPKGVCGTHGAMWNRLRWAWETFPWQEGERLGHRSSLSFVDAGPELFTGLLRGVPTVVLSTSDQADLSRFAGVLARHDVSRITVVPSILAALLRQLPDLGTRLPRLRTWITSGEELPRALLERFRSTCPNATLINLYGTTEVTGDVTCAMFRPAEALPTGRVPIGSAMAGATLVILDADGQAVPDGVTGELYAGGPVLARGYHRTPTQEALRFVRLPSHPGQRFFRTGDLVSRDASGALEYLGRADNLVKIRGVRVELEEIERALLSASTGVRDLATSLIGGDQLVAAVVPETSDLTALRAAAERLLPAVMRPSRYVPMANLPLSPNGKVDRRALALRLAPSTRAVPAEDRPSTRREREVATLWATLLGTAALSKHDRFSELGGTSLGLAEMLLGFERLPAAHRVDFAVARDATLADVALALDGSLVSIPLARPQVGSLTITPLSTDGVVPDDVVTLFVEASNDPTIGAMTELPLRFDAERARSYVLANVGVVFRLDGAPVGAGIMQGCPNVGDGVEVPPGAVQLDEWLLPAYRNQGLLSETGFWPLLRTWLAERADHEVSVVWEDHLAMIAILRARGYSRVGRSYWKSKVDVDVSEGWCEVWLYGLRQHQNSAPS